MFLLRRHRFLFKTLQRAFQHVLQNIQIKPVRQLFTAESSIYAYDIFEEAQFQSQVGGTWPQIRV